MYELYLYKWVWIDFELLNVYNMRQDVLQSLCKNFETAKHEYKYPIRINENIAIGKFKEKFINLLIEPNNTIREENLLQLQRIIEKNPSHKKYKKPRKKAQIF